MLPTVQMGRTPGVAEHAGAARRNEDPAKVLDAAKQFEALLIGEMMKSMREASSGGWLGSDEDAASDSAMAMAQQYFSQALAQSGGLGLSKLVAEGLEHSSAASRTSSLLQRSE